MRGPRRTVTSGPNMMLYAICEKQKLTDGEFSETMRPYFEVIPDQEWELRIKVYQDLATRFWAKMPLDKPISIERRYAPKPLLSAVSGDTCIMPLSKSLKYKFVVDDGAMEQLSKGLIEDPDFSLITDCFMEAGDRASYGRYVEFLFENKKPVIHVYETKDMYQAKIISEEVDQTKTTWKLDNGAEVIWEWKDHKTRYTLNKKWNHKTIFL